MKSLYILLPLLIFGHAEARNNQQCYTLEEICAQYDHSPSVCNKIPFCQSQSVKPCVAAQGQPSYVQGAWQHSNNKTVVVS